MKLYCSISACSKIVLNNLFFAQFRARYSTLNEEAVIVNTIGMTLIALAILMGYFLQRNEYRFRPHAGILIRTGDI